MLYPFQAPRQRAERFIALGRLALASFSLLAIWLDPSEPAEYAALTYTLLAGYLAYAVIVVVLVMAAERSVERLGAAFHVVDIALFTTFIALTQGPTSPFFVYFVFALLAAALRWQWQGVAWTALAILAIYLGLGLYAQQVLRDPAFQLNRFIIRSVYLAVVAVLVGYLSAYEQQRRAELAKLAAWPRHVPQASLIEAALRQAAAILGGTRLLMLWEEAEEPWRYRATLEGDSFTSERMSAEPAPLVAEPLAAADFLCLDPAGPAPTVLHTAGAGVQRWHGPPLAAGVAPPEAGSILALRLQGEQVEGRLFCFGKPGRSVDDLALGRIVARQIAADLDQFVVQQRLHQALVSEERVRFARELHDGVLQSLTGLALQLEVVKRLLATDPATARARLSEIQDLVAAEQGDLRFFVNQMRPLPHAHLEVNTSLRAYLAELCALSGSGGSPSRSSSAPSPGRSRRSWPMPSTASSRRRSPTPRATAPPTPCASRWTRRTTGSSW